MAIIASFPSLGGGRMVIPDYGGVAGTGPATFLNFPMTISDKKPTADGAREGAIWVQTKNLLGEVTKIKITDQTPTEDSEDNILYFVVPSMKSLKMDVHQETGTWKPVDFHYSIGVNHQWLASELDDGSTIRLNLPKLYSKINGSISIENAWYWTGEEWNIASEVGRPFFKETLAVNLIDQGVKTSFYTKTLPFSGINYSVNSTGELLIETDAVGSNIYGFLHDSSFKIYKYISSEYTAITESISMNTFILDIFNKELGSVPFAISNVVPNQDASLLALCCISRVINNNPNFEVYFVILEKNADEYNYSLKTKKLLDESFKAATNAYTNASYNNYPTLSANNDFSLFTIAGPKWNWSANSSGFPIAVVSYDGEELNTLYYLGLSSNKELLNISQLSKVFDNYLCVIPKYENNILYWKFILTDGETILDTYETDHQAYMENASYERIGKYGVVTYATKDTDSAANYIMGLSYDQEMMQFVSTGVQVRTADTISNPIDEGFEHPSGEYLSHYSIQKDEALFTINGITLLMGGEAGANFDTETGVITPATTMMDQGVKVYEDTVSRSGQPNIYIGD